MTLLINIEQLYRYTQYAIYYFFSICLIQNVEFRVILFTMALNPE